MDPAPRGLGATIVTVSDEVFSGADADRGGDVAATLLADLGVSVVRLTVPDDESAIATAVSAAVASGRRIVMTCGGTGIGPADHTPDVVARLLSFEIPGIGEEIRRRGIAHTPQALVSREVAGAVVRADGPAALVLCAPGSRGGVRDALDVVGPMIGYILAQLDGAGHA